jgi:adenylate cyclase
VQQAGDRLRVNAQLIDATTGRHLWSERYDRALKDIFSVQDDISKEILTALRVKLVEGEQERVWARGTNNLEAYLKFLKAYGQFRSLNKNNMILTRQICEEAIGLDPKYQAPHLLLGTTHMIDLWFNWGESPRMSMEKAILIIQKAVTLDPNSDWAHAALGHLYLLQNRHDEAVKEGEKAVALNPNGDMSMAVLGMTFNHVGRCEEAITLFKEAQRRNPFCPAWYYNGAGSYNLLGRWDEAIAEAKRTLEKYPDHISAMTFLAVAYGNSGRLAEGRAIAAKILKIDPIFSLANFNNSRFKHPSDVEMIKTGLRKVGIPENPPPK